jgi:hypothetical protein
VVEEVGPDVTRIEPGDHVVLTWIKGAGISAAGPSCEDARGLKVNAGPIATFAERAVVSEDRADARSAGTCRSDAVAALLGCAVATAPAPCSIRPNAKGRDRRRLRRRRHRPQRDPGRRDLRGISDIFAVDIHEAKLDRRPAASAHGHAINARDRRTRADASARRQRR